MNININEEMIKSPSLKDIEVIKGILSQTEYEYWLQNAFLTWQWWFLLISAIVPWIIWWKKVDKKRLFEVTTFGLWWIIVAVILDGIGDTLHLWDYPIELTYLIPPLLPADLSAIPVTYMLLYQFIHNWRKYTIACVITASIFSFIIEPFFVKFEMLIFLDGTFKWNHNLSFVSFMILSLLIRLFHLTLVTKVTKHSNS